MSFKSGKTYKFTRLPVRGAQVNTLGRLSRKYTYERKVKAQVTMHLFRSYSGDWRETFSTAQMMDFDIQEVA
jgi:hypothetical protein